MLTYDGDAKEIEGDKTEIVTVTNKVNIGGNIIF